MGTQNGLQEYKTWLKSVIDVSNHQLYSKSDVCCVILVNNLKCIINRTVYRDLVFIWQLQRSSTWQGLQNFFSASTAWSICSLSMSMKTEWRIYQPWSGCSRDLLQFNTHVSLQHHFTSYNTQYYCQCRGISPNVPWKAYLGKQGWKDKWKQLLGGAKSIYTVAKCKRNIPGFDLKGFKKEANRIYTDINTSLAAGDMTRLRHVRL